MGEKVKPLYEFGFDLPDEGFYILKVMEAEAANSESGGIAYKVTSQIDGGPFDGQKHWENFPTRTKRNFAIKKMLGFLVKCGKMNEDVEFDSDMAETEGFKKEFVKVRNARYGAYLGHRTWKDREGNDKVSTESQKYLTVEEVREKWTELEKGAPTIAQEKKEEPKKQEPAKASVWR
jgi:hypothetical protein